ncbi:MAG: GTPase Era [Bacillota bacterium]
MSYKSGFVSIVGSPNVGKSTLLNRLVGQKISIVSPKAQTTRNRVTGVLTRAGYQIVFLDTPGIATPKNRLGEYMLKIARDSMNEVEAIVFVVDALAGIKGRDEALIERLKTAKAPVIAAINKVDAASMDAVETLVERLKSEALFAKVLKISAQNGQGVAELEAVLADHLVEGPQYFPEDMVTDLPERMICAELIREKALLCLHEEIPHGIGVEIEKISMRDEGQLADVYAAIYCEREGHKGILIGKGGSMLKRIGTLARKDIEWLLGVRVNLQLHVKVREDWRNSPSAMRELGYE